MELGILRSLPEQIQPNHTALVIVDMQNGFVHPEGLHGRLTTMGETTSFSPGTGHLWEAYPLIPRAVANLRSLLAEARKVGALRVFVRAIYDDEYLSPPMWVLRESQGRYRTCQSGTFGADFYEDIRPDGSPREVVVTKHRLSGSRGTDLDLVLRSNGIKTILMTGTATSGCVECTSKDGGFNDYYVVMVEDCCVDRQADRQEYSMQVMDWEFSLVTTAEEVRGIWERCP